MKRAVRHTTLTVNTKLYAISVQHNVLLCKCHGQRLQHGGFFFFYCTWRIQEVLLWYPLSPMLLSLLSEWKLQALAGVSESRPDGSNLGPVRGRAPRASH